MGNEKQLLAAIRNGHEKSLDDLYATNKLKFFAYGRKLIKTEAVLEDIYQDAIITFYENVRTGKVKELKSSISTYVISIGKFMIYRHLKRSKNQLSFDDLQQSELDTFVLYIASVGEENPEVMRVKAAIERLGEPCRRLLQLFYYEERDNASIVEALGYANTDVVKSQKYRCLKSLRSIVEKQRNYGKEI